MYVSPIIDALCTLNSDALVHSLWVWPSLPSGPTACSSPQKQILPPDPCLPLPASPAGWSCPSAFYSLWMGPLTSRSHHPRPILQGHWCLTLFTLNFNIAMVTWHCYSVVCTVLTTNTVICQALWDASPFSILRMLPQSWVVFGWPSLEMCSSDYFLG